MYTMNLGRLLIRKRRGEKRGKMRIPRAKQEFSQEGYSHAKIYHDSSQSWQILEGVINFTLSYFIQDKVSGRCQSFEMLFKPKNQPINSGGG